MANISRRNFIASAGLLLAGTLVGCGSNDSSTGSAAGSAASGTTYTIGVIQLTEHSRSTPPTKVLSRPSRKAA